MEHPIDTIIRRSSTSKKDEPFLTKEGFIALGTPRCSS